MSEKSEYLITFKAPDGHVVDRVNIEATDDNDASSQAEQRAPVYGSRVEDWVVKKIEK